MVNKILSLALILVTYLNWALSIEIDFKQLCDTDT